MGESWTAVEKAWILSWFLAYYPCVLGQTTYLLRVCFLKGKTEEVGPDQKSSNTAWHRSSEARVKIQAPRPHPCRV